MLKRHSENKEEEESVQKSSRYLKHDQDHRSVVLRESNLPDTVLLRMTMRLVAAKKENAYH
jgi:hypothetical protein